MVAQQIDLNKSKTRPGRIERLKNDISFKSQKLKELYATNERLKKSIHTLVAENKLIKRKFDTSQLELAVIKDPYTSKSIRKSQSTRSGFSSTRTAETSGHLIDSSIALLPNIRIINEDELPSRSVVVGNGRFGICYLSTFSHYDVCIKVGKQSKNFNMISEANILSKFSHESLPYLFGVCTKSNSIIMSYHGFKDATITMYDLLQQSPNSKQNAVGEVDGIEIYKQIAESCDYLHHKYRVLHNDIKGDNIVIAPDSTREHPKAVIIDFGKACEIDKGKTYRLSSIEKEQYKKQHQHIAPDLRDGLCQQCIESDVYSLGRLLKLMCKSSLINSKTLSELSNQCLNYNRNDRPSIKQIISNLK